MQPETRSRRQFPRTVLVPLAAVAVVALLNVATRPLGGGDAQPSFFVIGSARPGLQVGEIAPGTAQAGAPTLPLTDLDGAPLALSDFVGRPIWVIFWKAACEPCEDEAVEVAAAYAAHRSGGLVVLGIDPWDSAAVVRAYAADHPLDYPIAVAASSAVMAAYGVWGAPTHYFINSDGIIGDHHFGPMTRQLIDQSLDRIL
jgi:peroxiredoxin